MTSEKCSGCLKQGPHGQSIGPKEGNCTRHARECGAGQALFLIPYLSLVLMVSAPKCGFYESPYVDKNGEPNPHLQRSVSGMTLDQRRVQWYKQIYTSGTIHSEIVSQNEASGRYVPGAL